MQPGSAEDGNDRVANELLYRSAVVLDNGAHPAEVGRLHVLKCLRVEMLPDGGGSDEIAKEGCNRLPFGTLHRRDPRWTLHAQNYRARSSCRSRVGRRAIVLSSNSAEAGDTPHAVVANRRHVGRAARDGRQAPGRGRRRRNCRAEPLAYASRTDSPRSGRLSRFRADREAPHAVILALTPTDVLTVHLGSSLQWRAEP